MSEAIKMPETLKATATQKKKQPQAAKMEQAATDPVLYVGPTINGIAITGTVYKKVPDSAKKAHEKAPMILNLFIPVKEYGEAEKMIREKKGYVYSAYKEALKLKKGGNN